MRTPLTPGENQFLGFLLEHLSENWEIYIQPHLNGLRPDFVLLNPSVGLAVYEVKDTRLNSHGRLDSDRAVHQVGLYKDEVTHLYCLRTATRAGVALITVGLVFPNVDAADLHRELDGTRRRLNMLHAPKHYPLVGADDLSPGRLEDVFPEGVRTSSYVMTETMAADLRNWLIEPDVSARQRRPLRFINRQQRQLVTTRTQTGYRKISGPAGSGKSIVVAARAAQLASEGKDVLVVTFNITMLNYLMDLAVRWPAKPRRTRESITWLNFHHWCKRICLLGGVTDEYKALWRGCFARDESDADTAERILDGVRGGRVRLDS